MWVARFYDSDDIRLEEEAVPYPGPGEAIVRTRASGICSGDLMGWYLRRKAPLVFGHEVAGEVETVGEGVSAFAPGDRVFVHHHAPCLECRACRRGDHVHCAEWRSSRLVPGGMAERILVPSGNLARDTLRLPDAVGFEAAALVEPVACVVKSLRRTGLRSGERLFVMGLGIMGQLHVALAKRFGAGEVLVSDFDPWRRSRALEIGADRAFDAGSPTLAVEVREASGGEGCEAVVVGPGSLAAMETGASLVASGGRLVLFTTARPEERWPIAVNDLYLREVSIVPSYSCGPDDTREALRRIADGEIPSELLITHRFPLAQIREAYNAASQITGTLKTLIIFPD